jgi:hypothetical protein
MKTLIAGLVAGAVLAAAGTAMATQSEQSATPLTRNGVVCKLASKGIACLAPNGVFCNMTRTGSACLLKSGGGYATSMNRTGVAVLEARTNDAVWFGQHSDAP